MIKINVRIKIFLIVINLEVYLLIFIIKKGVGKMIINKVESYLKPKSKLFMDEC